ncbi:MAG: hypothetical protein M1836_002711 [Candelina mexicana]|nr:MAG: hypothetical protein M1836_002711 [Candelina mexicana]
MSLPSTPSPTASAGSGGGGGANVGAIVGGVIGGVVVIAVIVGLVWRFCIKNRRKEYDEDVWPGEEEATVNEKGNDNFALRRDARASTHTVGSVASTVLTRASNIIQIAYIPGVTNRSPPSTPGLLIPPVPPLAFGSTTTSAMNSPSYNQEQHFFMPDDLRDSTYSGVDRSGPVHRPNHTSITPSLARSSVATTIYRNNAVINPVPAQTVVRGKAAVVSVKSGGTNSPTESPGTFTPPMPAIDQRYAPRDLIIGTIDEELKTLQSPVSSESSKFKNTVHHSPVSSDHSTLKNNTATTPKAPTVRPLEIQRSTKPETSVMSGGLAPADRDQRHSSLTESVGAASNHSRAQRFGTTSTTFDDLSSDEDAEPHERSRRSLMGHDRIPPAISTIEETPNTTQSPFADTSLLSPRSPGFPERNQARKNSDRRDSRGGHRHKKSSSLSAVIEEATRRATRQPTHGGLGSVPREPSPFGDENEIKNEF